MRLASRTLRHRVVIQSRVGADAAGQPTDAWVDVCTLWANIKSQTGLHAITSAQGNVATSVAQYSIRIRYRQGITDSMRVVHRGQIYDIKLVQMDEDQMAWTDLVCQRGGSNG